MTAAAAPALQGVQIRPERPQDGPAVDALIAAAFGPGRFAKSAERLREGRTLMAGLSLVAWDGELAAGCVRMWPIQIGPTPAILLGPFAVADSHRSRGLGAALVQAACQAAASAGHGLVLLVGDPPFFERLGFETVARDVVELPGPVDERRLMWRGLVPGALEGVAGAVAP